MIQLAQEIVSGKNPVLPAEYQASNNKSIRASIIDYAGEYLGVLALVYGRSNFPKRSDFEKWLGGSISDLTLRFPDKSNENLADSYAMIKNAATSHSVNISSKGQGGGAAPAISGLKVPEEMRNDPNYADAIKFIDICQKKGVKGGVPSTIQQAFDAIDFIYEIAPDSLPAAWSKILPLSENSPELLELCIRSIETHAQGPKYEKHLPNKYYGLFSNIQSSASEGGKVIYNMKKTVANAINNKNAIPNFKAAILEILEMNFVQQYTDYKSGQLSFVTQWPAKLDGVVSVENKSTAKDPRTGGFSFKLGRVDSSVSAEPGQPRLSAPDSEQDFLSKAANIVSEMVPKPSAIGSKKR